MLNAFQDYVDYIFLGMVISGIFFIIDDDIKLAVNRFELKRSLRLNEMNIKKIGSVSRHIGQLLDMLPGKKKKASDFMRLSATAALVVFAVAGMCAGSPACFAAAAVTLAAPYAVLRIRCEKLRAEVNDEREKLISLILTAYRMNNLNIEKAIEYAAAQTADLPHISPMLSTMLLRLRECSNENDIRAVTDGFARAVGSGWAVSLAVNIRMAYVQGRDIHLTLEEQLKQITETKKLMQERMRSNNESVKMTSFMVPVTITITAALAAGQMDMSLAQVIKTQFSDSTGCMLFIAIAVLFAFNLASTQIFLKKRTDL